MKNTFNLAVLRKKGACDDGVARWKKAFGTRTVTLAQVFARWANMPPEKRETAEFNYIMYWARPNAKFRRVVQQAIVNGLLTARWHNYKRTLTINAQNFARYLSWGEDIVQDLHYALIVARTPVRREVTAAIKNYFVRAAEAGADAVK